MGMKSWLRGSEDPFGIGFDPTGLIPGGPAFQEAMQSSGLGGMYAGMSGPKSGASGPGGTAFGGPNGGQFYQAGSGGQFYQAMGLPPVVSFFSAIMAAIGGIFAWLIAIPTMLGLRGSLGAMIALGWSTFIRAVWQAFLWLGPFWILSWLWAGINTLLKSMGGRKRSRKSKRGRKRGYSKTVYVKASGRRSGRRRKGRR